VQCVKNGFTFLKCLPTTSSVAEFQDYANVVCILTGKKSAFCVKNGFTFLNCLTTSSSLADFQDYAKAVNIFFRNLNFNITLTLTVLIRKGFLVKLATGCFLTTCLKLTFLVATIKRMKLVTIKRFLIWIFVTEHSPSLWRL